MRLRAVTITVFFLMSGRAMAWTSDWTSQDSSFRDLNSTIELIPDFTDLDCEPSCEGNQYCTQLNDVNSCLDASEAQGCVWSCR